MDNVKRRSPFLLAALASAAAPKLNVVAANLTDDLPRTDEGRDIETGMIIAANGSEYDMSLATGRTACALLKQRAKAGTVLSKHKDSLRALDFDVDFTSFFKQMPDEMIDDEPETALLTPHLDGEAVPFEYMDTSLCASLGSAIGRIHQLNPQFLTDEGYQRFTSDVIRTDLSNWISQLENEPEVPSAIVRHWRQLISVDALWEFETRVVHGNFVANDVLFTGARISAVRNWEHLQISDPAHDFAWLVDSSVSDWQRDAVLAAYGREMGSAMDSRIIPRARLWHQMAVVTDFLKAMNAMDREWIEYARERVERLASLISPLIPVTPNKSVNASPEHNRAESSDSHSTITVGSLMQTSNPAAQSVRHSGDSDDETHVDGATVARHEQADTTAFDAASFANSLEEGDMNVAISISANVREKIEPQPASSKSDAAKSADAPSDGHAQNEQAAPQGNKTDTIILSDMTNRPENK